VIAVITAGGVRFAVYLGIGLLAGLLLREYTKAQTSTRLGDMTPKLYGRATLRPKPHFDPLGTGILPGFLLALAASGLNIAPFAYAKPMPQSPERLRNPSRDIIWVSLAGPGANLVMAIVVGGLLRLVGLTAGDLTLFLAAALQASIVLCVFHLMPIPGLDASWILARFLHGRAREVYTNLNQFLPLFMIVIYFLIGAPVLTFVRFLGNALCGAIVGGDCL
jgi:Zn-dependent protease